MLNLHQLFVLSAYMFGAVLQLQPATEPEKISLFTVFQDRLAVFYENGFIQSAQRHKEVPRLTEEQLRAIEVFDGLASSDALRMDYVLQPGDIQLLHNHQIVHTRSEYLDFEVCSDSNARLLYLGLNLAQGSS